MQCGYCLNGWIMTAADLLEREKNPSRGRSSKRWTGSSAAAARTSRSCARYSALLGDAGMTHASRIPGRRRERACHRRPAQRRLARRRASGRRTTADDDPRQLDSHVARRHRRDVLGQSRSRDGAATGLLQLAADEFDVPFAHVRSILGDTLVCPDSGGVGGSTSTFQGNFPVRHAAAEMRRILIDAAAQQLGVPATSLSVTDGVVYVDQRSGEARRLRRRSSTRSTPIHRSRSSAKVRRPT